VTGWRKEGDLNPEALQDSELLLCVWVCQSAFPVPDGTCLSGKLQGTNLTAQNRRANEPRK
jgi:hypothetical protein